MNPIWDDFEDDEASRGVTDAQIAEQLFPDLELVRRYVDILTSRGIDLGVIGPREVDRVWDRHILNSVALADLIPEGSSVVDVGSGAGLPGIPLALLRPDLEVTLLEPLLRRYTFLSESLDELGIAGRVAVVRNRAEQHRDQYDVVTARALAPLTRLLEWCSPLMASGGTIIALKGRSAPDEIIAAQMALVSRKLTAEILSVRAHPEAEPTSVVRVTRTKVS